MGVMLWLCTCGGSQLQRGLCVVLHSVLQGPLHIGFGIQQQLQRWSGSDMMGKREVEKKKEGGQGERERVIWLIGCQSGRIELPWLVYKCNRFLWGKVHI